MRNCSEIFKYYYGFISESFCKELEVSVSLWFQIIVSPFAERSINLSDFLQQSRYADHELSLFIITRLQ